jgi:Domain of unknown function (DUF4340)
VNLRTTVVLLVLLALAGGGIWWATRGDGGGGIAGPGSRRILPGLQAAEVTSITLVSERGDTLLKGSVTFTRGEDGGWTVRAGEEAPVRARAERVRSLLESLREAIWLRELTGASRDALGAHGLDPGRRVVVGLATSSGARRQLEFGAVVSEGGVAVRADGGWPPVEVDRQLLDEVIAEPGKWVETRLLPFDPGAAQAIRVTFPKSPEQSFRASREAGQWAIREPVLLRADQGLIMRLIASLSSLESRGPYEAEGAAPGVLVRYEVEAPPRARPYVIEIGEGTRGDLVPAREGGTEAWRAASLAGLELVTRPAEHFRSRKLLDLEAANVQDVQVSPGPLHLVRKGPQLFFEPPADWGWRFLGSVRSLPLDATAQADFLQALGELEAAEFEAGSSASAPTTSRPAFEPTRTVVIRHGPPGSPGSEIRLKFGADEGGKRAFARLADAREGSVKSTDLAFLEKPYWQLLARQAYNAAWFSFATIEVEERGKRRAVATAISNAGSGPEFVLTEPHGAERRRIPLEIIEPVTSKLSFLGVERFVAHGKPEAFGLDQPRWVVKWHDSAKSQGVAPDTRSGQWITWRIAERGADGGYACDLDTQPGLIFRVEARDLDPFINLLEWSAR